MLAIIAQAYFYRWELKNTLNYPHPVYALVDCVRDTQ